MDALSGPFFAVCVLLALAGGFKIVRPRPTVGAARAVRLPASPQLVRVFGIGEVAVGAGAAATGWAPLAAVVAVAYAGFAGFVVAARRRGTAIQSCGCFGSDDLPPTRIHLVVNVAASLVAGAAAITRLDGAPSVVADQPLAGVPFVLLVGVTVWFLYLLLTALPAALHPSTSARSR
ncbi:MAG: MauE/DoxX family redox-associated membrane protein [Acidimicrobiales bacterium]